MSWQVYSLHRQAKPRSVVSVSHIPSSKAHIRQKEPDDRKHKRWGPVFGEPTLGATVNQFYSLHVYPNVGEMGSPVLLELRRQMRNCLLTDSCNWRQPRNGLVTASTAPYFREIMHTPTLESARGCFPTCPLGG